MILSSNDYFRLQAFSQFWEAELDKHPRDRYKPSYPKYDIFLTHSRNMQRMKNIMPKKAKQEKTKFEWKGYKSIHIPEAKIKAMEAFVADDKNVYQLYNSLLTTDYQFKQFFDTYTDSIKTTVTCYNTESVNFGYALSAYADNWYDSLAILIFKHEVLSQRDWDYADSSNIRNFG